MKLRAELRYSHSRLHYLTNRINELGYDNDDKICVFYFQERLKSILNEQNNESVNWIKICNSLIDFYGGLAKIYGSINFKNIRYRNKTIFNVNLPTHLHYLSKRLLNLCLNKEGIIGSKIFESSEIFLFEIINYYTILCIEIISFFKVSARRSVSDTDCLLLEKHQESLRVDAEEYTRDFSAEDISVVNTLISKANLGHSVFDQTTNFDLKQFALFFLLCNFDHSMSNNHILVKNSRKLKKDLFENLAFNLLIRLPEIESNLRNLIYDLMQALKSNLDFEIDEEALKLKSGILECCKEINVVRNKMNFKRCFGSITKLDRFPAEICCRRKFRRRHYSACSESLHKIPLSNLFPSSPSKCSWDMDGGKIYNIVIPNERINKLLTRLTSGKIWDYRFDYLYSEKAKLLWDLGVIIILIMMFFVTHNELVKAISISGILIFMGKILTKDLAYWIPKASKLIKYIKE